MKLFIEGNRDGCKSNERALRRMGTSGANLTSEGEGLRVEPASREEASHADLSRAVTRRSSTEVLKSYFYWTYSRGSFHYDVMVTLILAFIFITPFVWDYGDKPRSTAANTENIIVRGDGGHGLIVTLQASDVIVPAASPDAVIRKALKKAMEPVLGDSMYVERWELDRDRNGNPVSWKVWAHR
jgi:hypothetical protein